MWNARVERGKMMNGKRRENRNWMALNKNKELLKTLK